MEFEPYYTTLENVKLCLQGKIKDSNILNELYCDYLGDSQIKYFINKAEAQIEQELSRQYIVPLRGLQDEPFNQITDKRTYFVVHELANLKSCILILDNFFGDSEGVRGKAFSKNLKTEYDLLLDSAIGLDYSNQYKFTPLPAIKLNPKASYRSEAGAQAPMTPFLGKCSGDNVQRVSRHINTNIDKSLWYGIPRYRSQ